MGDDPRVEWLLDGDYIEAFVDVAPSGEWIAYQSLETGDAEIYVRPFPNLQDDFRRVSVAGGHWPRWSPDGASLFHWFNQAMMRVPVEFSPEFALGTPEVLFEGPYAPFAANPRQYDVAPDGRFLMLKPAESEQATATRVILVQNWAEELTRLVPTN